ncbi:MAG: ester cyclase [Gammaproteobacteria bacterium]|nr:ester cyclase [Gammaproteobacteria bacterium]
MTLEWCQYWIGLFAKEPDELIGLYSPEFLFEDINMGVRIENDLPAMKTFQAGFIVESPELSYNKFDVFDYVGDRRLGSFQWTWETKHAGDFLGVPAAGKVTRTKGVTVMGWDENGKIVLERSIWDAWAVLQQLDAIKLGAAA